MSTVDPPGEGILITIESGEYQGAALTYKGELIHTNAFFIEKSESTIDEFII